MIDNYITKEVSDGVAFLYLNQKDSKVNIVSPSLIDVFGQIIDQIINNLPLLEEWHSSEILKKFDFVNLCCES